MAESIAVRCEDCSRPYPAQKVRGKIVLPTEDGTCRCGHAQFVVVTDNQPREWPAPVPVERGDSALLLTPSRMRNVNEECVAAALPTNGRSIRALTVSVNDSVDTVLEWWNQKGNIRCVETAVVTVGGRMRSGTAGPNAGEITYLSPEIMTTSVSHADDFTGLGIAITSCLNAWSESDEEIVLYFDSVTPLLHLTDTQRVFRFLHTLMGSIREADARAYFHLDPAAHDDRALATIRTLFDVTAELGPDGTWETR